MSYDEFLQGMMDALEVDTRDIALEAIDLYRNRGWRSCGCKWEIIEYVMLRLKARGDYSLDGLYYKDAKAEGFSNEEIAGLIESRLMYATIIDVVMDTIEEQDPDPATRSPFDDIILE